MPDVAVQVHEQAQVDCVSAFAVDAMWDVTHRLPEPVHTLGVSQNMLGALLHFL